MSKATLVVLSALCLTVCLTAPVLLFRGSIGMEDYKSILLAASLGWFGCAAVLAAKRKG